MDTNRPFWFWFSDLNVKRCSVKAKSQKGFLLSGSNAVRRWLEARYPVTRASQSRDGGRIPRAGWLKESGIVQCEDMAPKITGTERTVFTYGKAVLCSNIHQRSLL